MSGQGLGLFSLLSDSVAMMKLSSGARQAPASLPSFQLCAHTVIQAGLIRKVQVKDKVTCLKFSSSPASSVGNVCLKPETSDSFAKTMLLGNSS